MKRFLLAAVSATLLPGFAAAFEVPLGADQQDLIYFSASGPVKLRYHIHADGKAVSEPWQKFVDLAFDYADKNGDGKIDKDEIGLLAALPLGGGRNPYIYSFDVDGVVVTDRSRSTSRRSGFELATVDTNKDGTISRAEVYAHLKRRGLGPVKVVISAPSGSAQQLTDALYKYLDANKDGRLSKAELEAAPEALAKLDQNEDEIITAQELQGRGPRNNGYYDLVIAQTELVESEYFVNGAPRQPQVASDFFVVSAAYSPDQIAKQIIERADKDKNGALNAAELKMANDAFAKLDKDGNGALDAGEIEAWLKAKPDVEFVIALSGGTNAMGRMMKGGGGPTRPIEAQAAKGSTFEKLMRTGEDGVPRLMLPEAILSLSMDRQNGFRIAFVNMTDQIDQLFKTAAGEAKFLDKKKLAETPELQYLLGFFDVADRNGDGKLELAELKRYTSLQQAGNEVQAQINITDQGRGLFDLIDVNHDDRLGVRELRSAWKQVALLERGGKGVGRDNLPRQFPAFVSRVNLTENYGGYAFAVTEFTGFVGQGPRRTTAQGPVWYQKMDRNGDGDVSRKEFLGPPALFDKIDKDGDGLIGLNEAQEAEKEKKN